MCSAEDEDEDGVCRVDGVGSQLDFFLPLITRTLVHTHFPNKTKSE